MFYKYYMNDSIYMDNIKSLLESKNQLYLMEQKIIKFQKN
jgi:hypothetical protein